jgi:hypothetical protein
VLPALQLSLSVSTHELRQHLGSCVRSEASSRTSAPRCFGHQSVNGLSPCSRGLHSDGLGEAAAPVDGDSRECYNVLRALLALRLANTL